MSNNKTFFELLNLVQRVEKDISCWHNSKPIDLKVISKISQYSEYSKLRNYKSCAIDKNYPAWLCGVKVNGEWLIANYKVITRTEADDNLTEFLRKGEEELLTELITSITLKGLIFYLQKQKNERGVGTIQGVKQGG